MFSTIKHRLLLGVYIFLLLSIPIGSYLASSTQVFKSRASQGATVNTRQEKIVSRSANTSASKTLLQDSQESAQNNQASSSAETVDEPSTTIADTFGPTLSLKATLEGRPADNQATKLFIGIVEGILGANPKFLLSFTIDLPKNGVYEKLSLAGLSVGSQYTALIKGEAQIATSSAFTMAANVTNLNNGKTLNMLSGDLNDDNAVTSADFDIVQQSLGSRSGSENWNELADLNKDGIINTFDLSIVKRNIAQTGASETWTSPDPATSSASINTDNAIGGFLQEGYWMWIPK